MARKHSNKRTELSRQVGIFNKQLQRLIAKNSIWSEVFEKQTAAKLRSVTRSETDALREIERMNALLKGEANRREVNYMPTSDVKLPQGALIQIETLMKRANVASEKKYKAFPAMATTKKTSVERERYKAIDKGSGADLQSVKKRIRTIRNRADPAFNKAMESAYLNSFLITADRYMPQYFSQIKRLADKIENPFGFYMAAVNALYGGDLQLEYLYPSEEATESKAQNVIKALTTYLRDEKNGKYDYGGGIDIFEE